MMHHCFGDDYKSFSDDQALLFRKLSLVDKIKKKIADKKIASVQTSADTIKARTELASNNLINLYRNGGSQTEKDIYLNAAKSVFLDIINELNLQFVSTDPTLSQQGEKLLDFFS